MSTIKRKILVMLADPAGNKTAFVLSGAKQSEYKGIAGAIFERDDMDAEQVAFVTGTTSIEMSGLEFCGNAARAFALITAKGIVDGHVPEKNKVVIPVNISGAKHELECEVDIERSYTKIKMPPVKRVKILNSCEFNDAVGSKVMVMDGIIHLILEGVEYDEDNFSKIKKSLIERFDPESFGVLYVDTKSLKMTPVVYVKDVDSTYLEGSCGSGTTAFAYYLSDGKDDGTYAYDIEQPGGTIRASTTVESGKPSVISIEGPVDLNDPEMIEIEYDAPEDEPPEDL